MSLFRNINLLLSIKRYGNLTKERHSDGEKDKNIKYKY